VRTFIIAEAGVNHDGSLDKALRLIDIAAEAGADAIKFQTFRTEEIVTATAPKAEYQQRQTGVGTQFDMIRALELSEEAHGEIARRCDAQGIEFMSTPFSVWGLDLLVALGVRRIKVASGEIVNAPLLRAIARQGLPIILSTGMATLAEVERAVLWIREEWALADIAERPGDLVILHCTSDYPAAPDSVNLRAMDAMRDALNLPMGYSDHTIGGAVSIAAVARGASVIEKHFTIDQTSIGPDHAASLSPSQLSAMIADIRGIEVALGDGVKRPMPNELATRQLVRRSAFATRAITKGTKIDEQSVQFLRPAGGIGPEEADRLFATRASRDISAGDSLTWDDLIA
jgi:N-acetylneuraminate synthase